MSRLKTKNSEKCFSILREFIDDAPLAGSNKQRAILALEQLQKITAGTTETRGSPCIDTPLADGTRVGGESSSPCIDTPLADGTPPPNYP